jgi:hypothetical protein
MQQYSYATSACLSCHPTGSAGRYTEHDIQFFPIFSGRHVGTWNSCESCHPTATNKQVWTCLECHEHAQAETDPVHAGMQEYSYTSSACMNCHPSGDAGRYTDHDALFFPIFSGRHASTWNSCAICHPTATNKKVFTCIECHEHNQQRTDDQHRGEANNYTYTATSCYDCHPDGRGEN